MSLSMKPTPREMSPFVSVTDSNCLLLPRVLTRSSPGTGALNLPMLAVLFATCAVRSPICFLPMLPRGSALAPFRGAALICNVGGKILVPCVATAACRFFCCFPAFFSTLSFFSLSSFVNGSSALPPRLPPFSDHLPSMMMILFASPARSFPCLRRHSSVCSSKTTLERFRFLIPLSLANFSHFVKGFSCGGNGFVLGKEVVPGGKCTNRPFTSDSLGRENKSDTSLCSTALPRSRDASVLFGPPLSLLNSFGSSGALSHTSKLPRSISTGPSHAFVASSADATRMRAGSSVVAIRCSGL
mmetsp:Transcript_6776/g.25603  ORF Transcript_6776/g.25603 Transcript_6776/m.25603 type:complete len:300 (-) Transcript_6776:178-1077(-)